MHLRRDLAVSLKTLIDIKFFAVKLLQGWTYKIWFASFVWAFFLEQVEAALLLLMQKTDDVKTFNQIPDFYLETRSPRKREREREREKK